jgi:CheY-like chemotaxis protein
MNSLPPILIAEDNDDDFFFFRRAARQAGIENPILRFRDGAELIAFLKSNESVARHSPPVLLFVDLAMPIMNGFEVLETLSAEPGYKLHTMILSGSKREEDMKRSYSLGAQHYLVKPVSPVTLAAIAIGESKAA